MKVFLGGTCNNSTWRDKLIPMLKIDYFNPVVEDWTPECMEEEIKQRQECDFCLYVITSEMSGVYSIAEVVDDSNKRTDKTIFCVLENGFDTHQVKSLKQVAKMVKDNGVVVVSTLEDVAEYLNLGSVYEDNHYRQALDWARDGAMSGRLSPTSESIQRETFGLRKREWLKSRN